MARQRMLSPDFFTDAKVLKLPPLERILFAGLWGQADRVGVLKDEPDELSLRILPRDPEVDVDQALGRMHELGLVLRYAAPPAGRLLWLPKFLEHQKPHRREKASGLPFPTLEQQRMACNPAESFVGPPQSRVRTAQGFSKRSVSGVAAPRNQAESFVGQPQPGGDGSLRAGRSAPPSDDSARADGVGTEGRPESENSNPSLPPSRAVASPSAGLEGRPLEWLRRWNGLRQKLGLSTTAPEDVSVGQRRELERVLVAVDQQRPDVSEDVLERMRGSFHLEEPKPEVMELRTFLLPSTWPWRLNKACRETPPREEAKVVFAPEAKTPAGELWARVLDFIERDGKRYALTWLERMPALALLGDELVLEVPDRFFRDWVDDHYGELMRGVLLELGEKTRGVRMLTADEFVSLDATEIHRERKTL